jgi:hypothetical protein
VIGHRLGQRRPGHVRRHQPRRRRIRVTIEYLRGEQAMHLPRRRDLLPEPGPEIRVLP